MCENGVQYLSSFFNIYVIFCTFQNLFLKEKIETGDFSFTPGPASSLFMQLYNG